jgi:hypothetical protein
MTEEKHLSAREMEEYASALYSRTLDALPESVRYHVANCLACRKEAIFLHRVNINTDASPVEDLAFQALSKPSNGGSSSRKSQNRPLQYRLAAGFALIVGLGAMVSFWYLRNSSPPPKTSSTSAAKVNESRDPGGRGARLQVLAQNSTPSENLEDVLAGGYRGEVLHILAPAVGDTVRMPVTLTWDGNGTNGVIVRVVNNREEEMVRTQTASGSMRLPESLTPGLYYWTIESNGSLAAIGKFYIY